MLADVMELDRHTCDRARRSKDARFDGRFFIGVTTTRIYCRPICPARAPKDENVRYFPTAAAAEASGFRPCLRCRPEASPGTPAWLGTSGLVSRALRLISEGALDEEGVERFSDRLGVTARHLRRLFLRHLGATPLQVALTRRSHFAKKLLDETNLSVRDVALAAGFGSVRRFNSQIRRTYSRTPTELRRRSRQRELADPEVYRFRLSYRPPYDWGSLLSFLCARAVLGVEAVDGQSYQRAIAIQGKHGSIRVSRLESTFALSLEVRFPDPRALLLIVERVRRLFDLGADPAVISEHLGSDPLLRPLLARHPGIRVAGPWDGSVPGPEPDTFPSDDPVLRRVTGARSPDELDSMSRAWRPWRAYAAMLLWQKWFEEDGRLSRRRYAPTDRTDRSALELDASAFR